MITLLTVLYNFLKTSIYHTAFFLDIQQFFAYNHSDYTYVNEQHHFKKRLDNIMGIRPNKAIGWGIEISGTELNEAAIDKFFDKNELSYKGLLEHLDTHNLMTEHRKHGWLSKANFEKLDEDQKIFEFIDVISKNYDSDEDFEDDNWHIMFYPMVLSPLAFHNGADEFKDYASPFAYAEIEHFFPESMTSLETISYIIDTPPFPSEYSVVKKVDDNDSQNKFTHGFDIVKGDVADEMKQALRSNMDDKHADIYATLAGFDSVEELKNSCMLAPAEEIIALAHYSGLFKDDCKVLDLRPTVMYYWV